MSSGFGGELKIWGCSDGGDWSLHSEITRADCKKQGVGDIWAIALSADEQYVACTTHDGKIHVLDLVEKKRLQTYETGSATGGHFGMCVDLSRDGRLTASGHMSGAVYVFNNDTGRMAYSLSSESIRPRLWHNARLCHATVLTNAFLQVLPNLSEQWHSLPATVALPLLAMPA